LAAAVSAAMVGVCSLSFPAQAQLPPDNNQLVPISSYLPAPNVEPPRFLRIEESGATDNGDYLAQIMSNTKDRVYRFVNMPVRVYIQPPPKPEFELACERAWQNWQFRSVGLVSFIRVPRADQARVRILWAHLGDSTLGGHTITNGTSFSIGGVPLPVFMPRSKTDVPPQEIDLNLDPILREDAELQPLLVENLVTHEIGHALGLIGHSLNRDDMMYTETDVFSRITQRDLNTLRRLYKLRADVTL